MKRVHFFIILILALTFSFIYNYSFTIKASTTPDYSSNYSIESSFIQLKAHLSNLGTVRILIMIGGLRNYLP